MQRSRIDAPSRLSRRAVVGSAGALGLALATHRLRASAQDATPAAPSISRAGHPVIGTWQLDNDLANPGTNITVVSFYPDGTYLAYHDGLGVGIGLWRATGERTAEYVASYQRVAGSQNLTTLEAVFEPDYVPTGHAFDPEVATIRNTSAVDETGNTMTLEGALEVRDPDGTVAFTAGDYRAIGTRMAPVTTAAATPSA